METVNPHALPKTRTETAAYHAKRNGNLAHISIRSLQYKHH